LKLKSGFALFKVRNEINKRKKSFLETRKLSDKEIVEHFSDEFQLPPMVERGASAKFLSFIVRSLSKQARKMIMM